MIRFIDALCMLVDFVVVGDILFDWGVMCSLLFIGVQVRGLRVEVLRQLRTNFQFVNVDDLFWVIVIILFTSGEGKSIMVTNLLIVFAEVGCKVLLIEVDFCCLWVMDYLGIECVVGLMNVLVG